MTQFATEFFFFKNFKKTFFRFFLGPGPTLDLSHGPKNENFEKMKNSPPPPPPLDYKIAPKTKKFDRGLSLERDPTFAEKSDRHTHIHTHIHFEVVDSTEVENTVKQ